MGRRLAMFFPDVARAVGFFRSYSREVSLDEVLSSLAITESVSERGGREILVIFDVAGSYAGDRAAAAARMHKGRVFTGTDTHYVPYRDRRAPLGYDFAGPESLGAQHGDFILYSEGGPDRRRLGRSIHLVDLVLGLSPRPLSASEKAQEGHTRLVVRCETGLARALCRYLWSRQVNATVKSATSARQSMFSGEQRPVHLVTCDAMPRHVAALIAHTPGLRVFVPVQDHILVEWGFRHPIALEAVGSAFSTEETVLFWGPPHKVERLQTDEEAVDIRDLVDVVVRGAEGVLPAPVAANVVPMDTLGVELRLARLPRSSAATTALLIDIERMDWFRKLVYLLPSAVLRSYEAAVAGSSIIVVNRRGVHGIPFGEPMTESYPQIFLPVGMQLLPRVDYELLREHLSIRPDELLYFFPEHKPAFCIPVGSLKPLSRALVAPDRARASIVELHTTPLGEPLPHAAIAHTRQGVFSLWRGTKAPAGAQALPNGLQLASTASTAAQHGLPSPTEPTPTNTGTSTPQGNED